jgi:L-Lysine epsilon oxidase N-terminal/L-lysine epsilon oxidase C-terminal domain/Iron-containing redox enzyme
MSTFDRPVAFCSIFPKIGIARLGDSDDYFIGPEAPGLETTPENGYKDASGQVKRQAARFRIYAFDDAGAVIGELTSENTKSIHWRANVANKKAAWHAFAGGGKALRLFEDTLDPDDTPPLRNSDWPSDRRALIIKATAAVSGKQQVSAPLEGPIYDFKDPVYLGELHTDDHGRLLFLGGHGRSKPVSDDEKYLLNHYANNDRWFDDTCDGVIDADVTLTDETSVPVRGRAWVIVAPPDFAPYIYNLVTLHDVMEETALDHDLPWHLSSPRPPKIRTGVSFVDDVYPILYRIVGYQWVNERALRGHGPGKRVDFLGDDRLGALANDKDPKGAASREHILSLLRNPNLSGNDAKAQANLNFMPQLSGDEGTTTIGEADTWLTVTKRQYETMQLWAHNKFAGFPGLKEVKDALAKRAVLLKPLEELPLAEQPFALTSGAVMACVGGAFFPGIEITSISRSKRFYQTAFEVAPDLEPGDVTKWMALPWQADFYECNTNWWPAQRPDAVVSEFDYQEAVKHFPVEDDQSNVRALLFPRKQWDRGVGSDRTFRPVFSLPVPADGETPDNYAGDCQKTLSAFCKCQWTNRGRSWQFPGPKSAESLSRYKFRLREYFDHYGSSQKWPFALPHSPAHETPEAYRDRLIGAFQTFIDSLVPAPKPGETLDAYIRRLNDNQSPWNSFLAGTIQVGYEVRQKFQGDNEMVHKWKTLGFVAQVPEISERILVETGRAKYDGLKDREYLYMMLNWESFPDFQAKARQLARNFLQAAWDLQETPQFKTDSNNNVYEFFEYSPSAFEARLQEIYERLAAQATLPADDWEPKQLVSRILQFAPFNQLDGAWLRYATDAGPIADINSLLFDIWSDETGNGDPALNHANLYTALMQSVGIYLPPLRSRAYADNPAILDSAYTNPLFELVISQFSKDFFPEILGMTLQLEWEVLGLWPGVKRLEAKHFNSQFYRMHIGIDNAVEGHGAKAKLAVQQYLELVGADSGPEEAARQWERIWTGYVAFETTGNVSDDFAALRDYHPMMEDRMTAMIARKKYFAQRNHSNLPVFGDNRMNDWFEEPVAFLDQLANSRYIVKGDPNNSYLINNRTTYGGPMYKIFTAAELKVWADWIRWLGKEYEPSGPPAPLDPALAMQQLVAQLSPTAIGVGAHMTTMVGGKSVADWFKAGPKAVMGALGDHKNGWMVPFSSATSKFITNLLPGAPTMEEAIRGVPIGGKDGVTVIKDWIDAGCRLPGDSAKPAAEMDLAAVSEVPDLHPTLAAREAVHRKPALHRIQIFGQDAVH